jgi:hypothetical protein
MAFPTELHVRRVVVSNRLGWLPILAALTVSRRPIVPDPARRRKSFHHALKQLSNRKTNTL